jgi:polysaccharide biosynthesis/export protein
MRDLFGLYIAIFLLAGALGCRATGQHHPAAPPPPPPDMPRELSKIALPTYTIEPPDVLVIEAVRLVPMDQTLRAGDVVNVQINVVPLPELSVNAPVTIQPNGNINLGANFGGNLQIAGMMIEAAENLLRDKVRAQYKQDAVYVSLTLVETAGSQHIAGQHLVGPDGTVTLGAYGSVPVVGLSLVQAKAVMEDYVRQRGNYREVVLAVDVFGYNSKVYYIITEGAGLGDGVNRFPVTGNETVLDAIANINGLTQVSSKKIWIARPVPHSDNYQILPVDWKAVTSSGAALTNYQIMPGDRVFVAEDKLVALDTSLAKLFAPLERTMGFTLLGAGTATRLSGPVLRGGGNPGGGFSGP